jgi:hypothetical protein
MTQRLTTYRALAQFVPGCIVTGNCYGRIFLDFRRITVQLPAVQLHFNATHGGFPMTGLLREDLLLQENGCDIEDFILHPRCSLPCPISIGLVIDASG